MRYRFILLLVMGVFLPLANITLTNRTIVAQMEPRFSFPAAGRYRITSFFDHSQPNYSVDGVLTIYTTEKGHQSYGCADCYTSGSIQVCGYFTQPNCRGRRIYYDGHPAIDYAFPKYTPIAAAAAGTAYRRAILGAAVVIDHGVGYWTRYGHVDPGSRIADGTQVTRGEQIALSSNTGTGAPHLHFEARYSGEYGTVFDPYGWWGAWYEDPWNLPWGHTTDWWRSQDPIPMGYRDQNGVVHGPFQIRGAIGEKWELLDGEPGSPLSDKHWCPPYGECQPFERGYIRWDYNVVTYYPYPETRLSPIFYFGDINWNTLITIHNTSNIASQVSIIFVGHGHVPDYPTVFG